jgi:hypothetical protein
LTVQPKEIPATQTKAKITITNYPGGKYFFTVDEILIIDEKLFLIESKHSKGAKLPSVGDIKDGLLKMMLYTNLENVSIDDKSFASLPILRLTSEKIARGENVFLFLDPPYFSATNSALYGKNGNLHKTFDHQRFAENLRNCPHRWLLTYDDSPFIRELFSFAKIADWKLTYGMRNVNADSNQKGCELFISNYEFNFSEQKQTVFTFA